MSCALDIQTFADYVDWPEGVPGWMGGYDTGYNGERYRRSESTRLVVFTKDSGHLCYCSVGRAPCRASSGQDFRDGGRALGASMNRADAMLLTVLTPRLTIDGVDEGSRGGRRIEGR